MLGSEHTDYNLIMATTFGMPINGSYIRDQMQKVIDKEGLPDVVFHSLRHTSVTYKLKLSGGDIKAVQGDSGHAEADMVTEVMVILLMRTGERMQREWRMPSIIRKILIRIYMRRMGKKIRLLYRME